MFCTVEKTNVWVKKLGPKRCLPHTRPVDGSRSVSASGMEDGEMGVMEKQLLPAACPHPKFLEGRLASGSGCQHHFSVGLKGWHQQHLPP